MEVGATSKIVDKVVARLGRQNISLYPEKSEAIQNSLENGGRSWVIVSLKEPLKSDENTTSMISKAANACGVIERSKMPKKSLVTLSDSSETIKISQTAPWVRPSPEIPACKKQETDVKENTYFSLYANNRKSCLASIRPDEGPWPKEAVAIVRGRDSVTGRLMFVQEALEKPLHIIGNVIGLSEGHHGLFVSEDGHGSSLHEKKLSNGAKHLGRDDFYVGVNHAAFIDIVDESFRYLQYLPCIIVGGA